MTEPLEDRLTAAGSPRQAFTPNLAAIKSRAETRASRRRVGFNVAMVALVAGGGLLAYSAFRSPLTVDAADGEPTDAAVIDETTTTTVEEGQQTSTTPAPIPERVLSDSFGGYVEMRDGNIVHVTSEGAETRVPLEQPAGGFVQRWVTDIAPVDGVPYLFIDEFFNRTDLAADRAASLYESYGLIYTPESDPHSDLGDVATAEELSNLEHWEVAIVAYNLATDDLFDVERRTIHSAISTDWVYNGHITADGEKVLVMRELWQSTCMYVDALTLEGEPVALDPSPVPAPIGLESLDFEAVRAIQTGQRPYPDECTTLEQIGDGGVAILGSFVDQAIVSEWNSELR
ncbi:MAG: hypothetical protein HKN03_12400 [Acidimicrobiales bacterium]|nr:hypothetical protein [Acidimicrobiales bacterium]